MDITKLIIESNLINFIIAVAAIAYLLIKVIPSSTEKRRSEIQKELAAAQEAKKAAEEKLKELELEITKAHEESKNIVATAKTNADAIKSQTIKDAKAEIDRLGANSQKEIEMYKEMAINTIKEQITHLTMQNVEKTLNEKKDELDKLIKLKLSKDLEKASI